MSNSQILNAQLLNPQNCQDLINISPLSLWARDTAGSHIIDQAAKVLASQLGLETRQALTNNEQSLLERSAWVDRQILNLLAANPDAIGLELHPGVSTRFHRLSSHLEWPRFRWADINSRKMHAFKQALLPVTDNYRSLGCDHCQGDLLVRAGWHAELPLIIVTENLAPDGPSMQLLLDLVVNARNAQSSPIHIIFTCQSKAELLCRSLPPTKLWASQLFRPKGISAAIARMVRRCVAVLSGLENADNDWQGVHCII
jgi:hypothetical protein